MISWEALVLLKSNVFWPRGFCCSCSTSVSFYRRQSISNSLVRELSEVMKSKWLPGSRMRFLLTNSAQCMYRCYKSTTRTSQCQKSLRYKWQYSPVIILPPKDVWISCSEIPSCKAYLGLFLSTKLVACINTHYCYLWRVL